MIRARSSVRGDHPRSRGGFTLVELLVVVSIIALLIAILLPSLKNARKQAQAVVCGTNCKQIHLALTYYQTEYNGFYPLNLWSERDWGVTKPDLWFYKLFPTYAGDPDVLVCPGDPYRQTYDFEASFPIPNFPKRANARANSCGYGMNYLFRHLGEPDSFNLERFGPRRPAETIMLAEVGPDHDNPTAPLPNAMFGVGRPWRDGGRIVWDDGARSWYSGPTWLTGRHSGSIDMLSLDGALHRVRTEDMLKTDASGNPVIATTYDDCTAGDCTFCNLSTDRNYGQGFWSEEFHYSFARANMYWWTGPWPDYD